MARDWVEAVRPPSGSVAWLGMLLLMLLLVHPLALATWVDDASALPGRTQQDMVLLLEDVAVLSAGILLKFEHASSARPSSWWLAVAVMVVAMQELPISLLAVAGSDHARLERFDVVSAPTMGVVVVGLLVAAVRVSWAPPINAFGVALLLGSVIAAVRLWRSLDLVASSSRPPWVAVYPATALLVILFAVLVVRLGGFPTWFRSWLLVAATMIVLSKVVSRGDGLAPAPLGLVLCGVAGTSGLLAATVALLRGELRRNVTRLLVLTHRAAAAEAAERSGRAQAHEVTAAVAGIAAAARLLSRADERTRERRRLATLLDSEMARLHRLLDGHGPGPLTPVRLGDVIEPLVRLRRESGHDVMWLGRDVVVRACADEVTEIVLNLLSNAARHAPGSPVEVLTRTTGTHAEVRVRDRGPGVDPAVRPELFEWGARSPGSPGQGVGLQVARDLARRMGGDLYHETGAARTGAVFVLRLPLALAPAPDLGVA